MKCPYCIKGKVTCGECDGIGKKRKYTHSNNAFNLKALLAAANPFDSYNFEKCEKCNGEGKVKCPTCKGTGTFPQN